MEQIIYADILFLIDFSMDFLALYIIGKILKLKINVLLFVLSACAGAGFSVFSVINHSQSIFVSLIVSIAMCFLAFIGYKLKTMAIIIGTFYGVNMLLGGVMTAIFNLFNNIFDANRYLVIGGEVVTVPSKMPLFVFYIGFIILVLFTKALLSFAYSRPSRSPLKLCITNNGRSVSLCVIEDSGNRLCEPISNDPIIFLKETALRRIVNERVICAMKMGSEFYEGANRENFRVVVYNTVSGKDTCVCTKIGRLTLENNEICAWVALGKNINTDGIDGIVPSILINGRRK